MSTDATESKVSVLSLQEASTGSFPPNPQALADDLSAVTGQPVPVVEGSWSEVPDRGFVLVSLGLFPDETLAKAGDSLSRYVKRLVLVHLDRALLRPLALRLHPAAMVEEYAFECWEERKPRGTSTPSGLVGHQSVVERYGLSWQLRGTAYAMAEAAGWDLAELLVDYLYHFAAASRV